jgi:hypothetical protein
MPSAGATTPRVKWPWRRSDPDAESSEHSDSSKEDASLVSLVSNEIKGGDEAKQAVRLAWVDNEYGKRLRRMRRSNRWWRGVSAASAGAVAVLGVVSALAGALGKGVANGGWSIAGIVTGSLVTAITGYIHTRKPDAEGDGFQQTRKALRREGWNFLQRLGPYKTMASDTSLDAAYNLFVERVSDLLDSHSAATRTGTTTRPAKAEPKTGRPA